jgi:hypothetical protein
MPINLEGLKRIARNATKVAVIGTVVSAGNPEGVGAQPLSGESKKNPDFTGTLSPNFTRPADIVASLIDFPRLRQDDSDQPSAEDPEIVALNASENSPRFTLDSPMFNGQNKLMTKEEKNVPVGYINEILAGGGSLNDPRINELLTFFAQKNGTKIRPHTLLATKYIKKGEPLPPGVGENHWPIISSLQSYPQQPDVLGRIVIVTEDKMEKYKAKSTGALMTLLFQISVNRSSSAFEEQELGSNSTQVPKKTGHDVAQLLKKPEIGLPYSIAAFNETMAILDDIQPKLASAGIEESEFISKMYSEWKAAKDSGDPASLDLIATKLLAS